MAGTALNIGSLQRYEGRVGSLSRRIDAAPSFDAIVSSGVAAYSTRKVRQAYAGFALQVRRSSDSATQDIGFDGSGNLDTAALASFIGANSGTISILYDQIGSLNLTQGTAASQPRIVNAGTTDTINGIVCPFYSGSMGVQSASTTLTMLSVCSVSKHNNNTGTQTIARQNATVGPEWAFRFEAGKYRMYKLSPSVVSAGLSTLNQSVVSGIGNDPDKVRIYDGGAEVASASGFANTATTGPLSVGQSPTAAERFVGNIAEVIIFPYALPNRYRQVVERNQGAYFGVTVL